MGHHEAANMHRRNPRRRDRERERGRKEELKEYLKKQWPKTSQFDERHESTHIRSWTNSRWNKLQDKESWKWQERWLAMYKGSSMRWWDFSSNFEGQKKQRVDVCKSIKEIVRILYPAKFLFKSERVCYHQNCFTKNATGSSSLWNERMLARQ